MPGPRSPLLLLALALAGCQGLAGVLAADDAGAQGGGAAAGGGAGGGGDGSSVGSSGGGAGGGGPVVPGADLDPPLTPGDPGAADVRVEVRSNLARHPISPLIYGTNQPGTPSTYRYTVLRSGGNRWTAYDWENNASNAGSDFGYQNDNFLSSSATPGAAITSRLGTARGIGAAAMLTVPIVDHVAADTGPGGDVRASGPDYLATRFRQNRATKDAGLSLTPDATDGFVYQDEFVAWVKANAGGTPILFSLDNEPDLWFDTHPEVHPARVGYAELLERNLRFAAAIKAVWPEAPVSGVVSYGYAGYLTLQDAPDAAGKGPFLDWYLDQLAAAEAAAGHRLVDYLDLHWYPEATGGGVRIVEADATPAVVAARVQAPRSLWDPTYTETSWIAQAVGGPIALLPWLQAKLAARSPGTRLAFTEWDYGGAGDVGAAVATADVLGIFGREGVGLATMWKYRNAAGPDWRDAAFAAFRNFDGAGGAFGDTSLSATSSDVSLVSAYASVDAAAPDRLVLVLINRDTAAHTVGLAIWHPQPYGRAHVYQLASPSASLVVRADLLPVALDAFRPTLPPRSVTVLRPAP